MLVPSGSTWYHAGMRLRKILSSDGEPKWVHPNGWTIKRETRDWDMRGYRDTVGSDSPKRWYEIRKFRSSDKTLFATGTRLRDVRAWCDEHHA